MERNGKAPSATKHGGKPCAARSGCHGGAITQGAAFTGKRSTAGPVAAEKSGASGIAAYEPTVVWGQSRLKIIHGEASAATNNVPSRHSQSAGVTASGLCGRNGPSGDAEEMDQPFGAGTQRR